MKNRDGGMHGAVRGGCTYMYCPACRHHDTKVVDTRVSQEGTVIRRRRECPKCDFRFSTLEETEILDVTVVKRDGRREGYNREKLESGIRRAFEKRSITHDEFRKLVTTIERDIQALRKSEVKSNEIGEIVMERLRRVDTVAYIRFASVYRQFEDVESFHTELQHLLKKKKINPGGKVKRARMK